MSGVRRALTVTLSSHGPGPGARTGFHRLSDCQNHTLSIGFFSGKYPQLPSDFQRSQKNQRMAKSACKGQRKCQPLKGPCAFVSTSSKTNQEDPTPSALGRILPGPFRNTTSQSDPPLHTAKLTLCPWFTRRWWFTNCPRFTHCPLFTAHGSHPTRGSHAAGSSQTARGSHTARGLLLVVHTLPVVHCSWLTPCPWFTPRS